MKTTATVPISPPKRPSFLLASDKAFLDRQAAWWAKFHRMSKAKQRTILIEFGALTTEGKVPVYPMDHVPLGPRE
jgi:hypothetical protein